MQKLFAAADATIKSRAWNDKKISAHHAIIPTRKPLTIALPDIELKIYTLIAKNYAVQFHQLHVYDETQVVVKFKGETFTARGKIIKQAGWRQFYVMPKPKADDESDTVLPPMKTGDAVNYAASELRRNISRRRASSKA